MTAHVLLHLLNELGKKDEMQPRLAEHFVIFRNKLNKFNNTGPRMLDFNLSYDP